LLYYSVKGFKPCNKKSGRSLKEIMLFINGKNFFSFIKTSPVLEILLNCHEHPKIIKSLPYPEFKCLKELSLNLSNIGKIEILPFLHA
jgi:hypothetical protein